jgi:hypothetical protein
VVPPDAVNTTAVFAHGLVGVNTGGVGKAVIVTVVVVTKAGQEPDAARVYEIV